MDRNDLLSLKKLIKTESTPGQRLTSLKLPRDLSLGGAVDPKHKKKFIPNLNIVRNKSKVKAVFKNNEVKHKEIKYDIRQDRKSDSDRFIQSSGIFSEGATSDIRRQGRFNSDRRSDKENDGGMKMMSMPLVKKKNWEVDKKNEHNILEDLIGCDADIEDDKGPFQPVPWSNEPVNSLLKAEVKTEIKEDICDNDIQPAFKKLKINEKACEYLETDIYDDYSPTLSVWKLPDSLCGKGLSDDPNCRDVFDYCLNDILEGQIGKLLIRKSGKIEVQIGGARYFLEQPELQTFREDIVSLEAKNDKDSSATVLGDVKHRYVLNPDWDSLLS